MTLTEIILAAAFIALVAKYAWDRRGASASPADPIDQAADAPRMNAPITNPTQGDAPASGAPDHHQLYDIGERLINFFNTVAHPGELVPYPVFQEGVDHLCGAAVSRDDAIGYALGEHIPISCMALEAIRRRTDTADAWREVLSALGTMIPIQHHFACQYLVDAVPNSEALIGPALGWTTYFQNHRTTRKALESLVRERSQRGEALELRENDITFLNDDGLGALAVFLASLPAEIGGPLLGSLEELRPRNARSDTAPGPRDMPPGPHDQGDPLKSVGRTWKRRDATTAKRLIRNDAIDTAVAEIKPLITARRPQSVLLVGEAGVGKTTLQSIIAGELFDDDWTIFVAGHADILAGQTFIGQFEQRLKQMLDALQNSKKVVWIIPGFDQLVFTGTHSWSSFSAMDAILPHIANGSIRVIAGIEPSAYDELVRRKPDIQSTMAVLTVKPASRAATLDIAAKWLGELGHKGDTEFLSEVWDLAQQYLGNRAAPGTVMDLVKAARLASVASGTPVSSAVTLDSVIETLARQSGMPIEILDPKRKLDLDDLRRSLSARVIGQDEAIACLVDRVAMIKAAVLDPSRPLGVFLFAGPTGTGKTEIAKSLAAWLFGSADRLIRIDMSELKDVQGLDRLIGSPDNAGTDSLADEVRKEPFSVVLLDEFEKAHPNIWDLFLQIFDDARVTDRRGQTTSFRNTIIILTVNLGATIQTGAAMGFANSAGGFDEDEVHAAIGRVFRREFVNRLDQVVVFRPLDRDVMRQILHRELEKAFERRGLKGRPWAAEWDESAIEFLLEEGFTPDLGARPLRRAIEQNLLAPLANTIVRHRFPEGDQFLFVSRRGNGLRVEFVDPDLEDQGTADAAAASSDGKAEAAGVAADGIRAIVLQPAGTKAELSTLSRCLDEIGEAIESDGWRQRKQHLFAEMERADFWNDPTRHSVLGKLETIDRIEKGLDRAKSLRRRLDGLISRQKPPARLIAILAQNLYLLSVASHDVAADAPQDAFLLIEMKTVAASDADRHVQFADRLVDMYETWSDKRNMRLVCLRRTSPRDGNGMRAIYGVSGYGAHSILSPETGLHVLEAAGDGRGGHTRMPVRVTVAPQPDTQLPSDPDEAIRVAEGALEKTAEPDSKIVRRYREAPSPLVRDNTRGWRTGRIDLVLGGDFDLL